MLKTILAATIAATAMAQDSQFRVKMDKVTAFWLKDALADMTAQLTQLEGRMADITETSTGSMEQVAASVALLAPSVNRVDALVDRVGIVAADVYAVGKGVDNMLAASGNTVELGATAIEQMATDIANAMTDFSKSGGAESQLKKFVPVVDELPELVERTAMAAEYLKDSHYMNPKAPVFKWCQFNTYQQNHGWVTGNSGISFGGIAPSSWGDGNAIASSMENSLPRLRKMFSKHGYGDAAKGANVCVHQHYQMHSTEDVRCGAIFRIKNTKTSGTVTWSMSWTFTGWQSWGNKASVALNKGNVWNGNCHNFCTRTEKFAMPSNGGGNRISTVIFMAGSSSDYGYYNQYRTNFLGFNSLTLPDGLEFVDDMESATGGWN